MEWLQAEQVRACELRLILLVEQVCIGQVRGHGRRQAQHVRFERRVGSQELVQRNRVLVVGAAGSSCRRILRENCMLILSNISQ